MRHIDRLLVRHMEGVVDYGFSEVASHVVIANALRDRVVPGSQHVKIIADINASGGVKQLLYSLKNGCNKPYIAQCHLCFRTSLSDI